LSTADAHIVSLIPRLEHCIVPSKFYGVLAAGRPTLFVGDRNGEVARVVATTDCGASVQIGEGRKLADTILEHEEATYRSTQMGKNDRHVLDTVYSRETAVRACTDLMTNFQTASTLTSDYPAYRTAQ